MLSVNRIGSRTYSEQGSNKHSSPSFVFISRNRFMRIIDPREELKPNRVHAFDMPSS